MVLDEYYQMFFFFVFASCLILSIGATTWVFKKQNYQGQEINAQTVMFQDPIQTHRSSSKLKENVVHILQSLNENPESITFLFLMALFLFCVTCW